MRKSFIILNNFKFLILNNFAILAKKQIFFFFFDHQDQI